MNINRQDLLKQTAEAHRNNIQKNWQRRMDAAKAKGDSELITQLEAEAQYLNF